METIKVILADDHGVVRSGIRTLLESEGDISVIAEASNGQEALEKVEQFQPDLLVVDIRMPVLNGIEATRRLPQYSTITKALVLSMHDDEEYILQSIESGAFGYLLKDTSKEEFLKAIRMVYHGEKYFSGEISGILVNNFMNFKRKEEPGVHADVHTYEITKREKQILRMLADGINNKEIAENLNKSVRTIETHRFNIMKKLKVNNVVELLKKVEDDRSLKEYIYN